ncbi:hypothetical protein CPC08DRAFT_769926 [Agrocybe pediades]|nr:hypothetical protein CPC08DRAFT_769926 [Agrocybe pediades]
MYMRYVGLGIGHSEYTPDGVGSALHWQNDENEGADAMAADNDEFEAASGTQLVEDEDEDEDENGWLTEEESDTEDDLEDELDMYAAIARIGEVGRGRA